MKRETHFDCLPDRWHAAFERLRSFPEKGKAARGGSDRHGLDAGADPDACTYTDPDADPDTHAGTDPDTDTGADPDTDTGCNARADAHPHHPVGHDCDDESAGGNQEPYG